MHSSAFEEMRRCVADFVPRDRHVTVVDFGSWTTETLAESGTVHRALLTDYDCEVIGVDIREGHNVDVVMQQPYRLPLKSNSADVVMSGQVFEHVPFFWASMLEIARVLKPGGVLLITVPSRGHHHTPVDCWRYYPDGIRAMAAFAGLQTRRAETDFPPVAAGGARHQYAEIDQAGHYWGDTVGVLEKPEQGYPRSIALIRPPLLWWANRAAGAFVSTGRWRRSAGGSVVSGAVRGVAARSAGQRTRDSRWAQRGSNPRPPPCKGGALPLSYTPVERAQTTQEPAGK
jgi:SAM-dependent methyltransferase